VPRYIRETPLSIARQAAALRADWPSLSVTAWRDELKAMGELQPTPISTVFKVSITYRVGDAPEAFVHSPALARRPERPDEPVPHVYPWVGGAEGHPCLFRPWGNEWHAGKAISRTIVPWLLTWLANYEVWRATGKWLGGGVSHGLPKTKGARST
jgi:hypothetical protein